MHVLLVLEQRAVQRRNDHLLVRAPQRFRRNVFGQQELQPVEKLGGRWLFLQSGNIAQLEEDFERFLEQGLFQSRKVNVDDARHRFPVWKTDVMKEAATQERVRQLFL